jgi:ribosomal protein L35
MASKLKKNKRKTHKATAKRFKVTKGGKVMHTPQGGGNGHSKSYANRRQRKAVKVVHALTSNLEARKIKTLMNMN